MNIDEGDSNFWGKSEQLINQGKNDHIVVSRVLLRVEMISRFSNKLISIRDLLISANST